MDEADTGIEQTINQFFQIIRRRRSCENRIIRGNHRQRLAVEVKGTVADIAVDFNAQPVRLLEHQTCVFVVLHLVPERQHFIAAGLTFDRKSRQAAQIGGHVRNDGLRWRGNALPGRTAGGILCGKRPGGGQQQCRHQ